MTDMVMEWIERVAHVPTDGKEGAPDICVIELGGTVGDIESAPFIEALRQFQFRVGRDNMCFFHVSLVPVLGAVGEEKTKPTQHTVQTLRSVGLTADFLVCRSSKPLSQGTKSKLALFCQVEPECCLGVHDVSNIYRVPLLLHHQGVTSRLLTRLSLHDGFQRANLSAWISLAELVDSLHVEVSIAVVGKYTELSDAYLSVSKARRRAHPAPRQHNRRAARQDQSRAGGARDSLCGARPAGAAACVVRDRAQAQDQVGRLVAPRR